MFKQILFIALSVLTTSAEAAPLDSVRLGGEIYVGIFETKSLPLGGARYIRNLIVRADPYPSDSIVEVVVNGQSKGSIGTAGRDPSFVFPIGEVARSIEFRHVSGGPLRIVEVLATVANPSGHPGDLFLPKQELQALSMQAMDQIEILRMFASEDQQRVYLFPIKQNAGLVYVMASAHGDVSRKTAEHLRLLVDQINYAQATLDGLMRQDGAFEAVVSLLTVREKVLDLLD
jgi:hypothetical protein